MALCGRDAELATVGRVFDGAANGTGQLLLIDGPPGVGKTALMQAARKDAARRGFQVMWARASPSDGVSAFAVVTQLWESLLAEAVPAERAELVGSLRRLAGNELVGSGPAVRLAAAEPAVLYEVLDRLYRSCVRLTRRGPAAIVVDDAQFSDSASSRWLAFLARRIDGLPVALLIAMPLGDLGDEPEPEPATELLSASRMQRVRLAPLDTAASRTLVAGVLGRAPDDAFIAKCQWATGGNPLFLSLLADAAAKQAGHGSRQCDVSALDLGPVAGYVRNQLRRISPEAVPFAEALAVLGHQADLATVAELARLDLGRASRLAGLMNRAGILVSPELAFAHPVVPRAIDADLPRHRRQAIHRETAAVLWRAGESQERVLAHLVTAGPVGEPWAADLLRRAATTALGDNDLGSAVMLLRRLLLEPLDANARTTAAALLDIADTRDGDHGASLRQLAEARDRLPMWGAGIGADLALIQFLAVMERYGDARRVAMQASVRAAAQGQLPALQLRSVVIGLGLCELASAGDALRSLAELEHTQPRLCEDPDTGLGWLRLLRDEWAGLPASHTQTTLHDLAGAGWPSGEAAGGFSVPDFLVRTCHVPLLSMLLHTDDLPQALAACDLLVDMAAAGGAPARHATSMALRAGTLHRLGWLADAAAECEQALPAALSARAVRQVSCLIVSIYLGILIDQGELSKASVLLVRTGLVGQLPRSWHYNDVLYARARLRTAGGAVAEGLSDYLECGQRMTGWGVRNPAVSDWRSRAAMAYAALGERDEALRLAAEEVELAESAGGARALGVALARLAEITGGSGGIQLACRAVRLLTATNAALDEAAARAVLGAMLLARGMRAAGEQQVRHAHRTAEARGATVLARQAARVLHEHGIPAGGGQPSGRVSLTEAERRVLALAEMGLSNQQIAHRLRVVLRTVEIHLTRGYRKLGIRGRTELPGQVTGPTLLGLSPPRS